MELAVVKFLSALKKNNNKPWFDSHRPQYESVKNHFRSFVSEMIVHISRFDHSIARLESKDCMFRINRDVRFSKDKRPYKNNFAAYFNKGGKKGGGGGYYIHIEPGNSFAAVGVWMPPPDELAKIRQEIDYNYIEWKNILSEKGFKKTFGGKLDWGETLVRPPKGYTEENPAIEYLKLKSFVAIVPLTDKELVAVDLVKRLSTIFQAGQPLLAFINRSLD